MMRRFASAEFVVPLLLAFPAAPPVGGAIIPVTTQADELVANEVCSLREAIQSANTDTAVGGCFAGLGADLILLGSSTTYQIGISGADDDANLSGDFDLASELVILGGSSTVVRGMNGDRVFHVLAGAHVTLRNLTISHGDPASVGGGVANGGHLVIDTCTVTLNESTVSGGGIASFGDSLRIVDSIISDNLSGANGGGVWHSAAARMQLIDSTVFGNSAFAGGGLWVAGLDARRSTIANNEASLSGGGIWKTTGSDADALVDGTVSGNRADGDGGGIYVDDSAHLLLASSTISANTADYDDVGAGSGGGLTVVGSSGLVRMANSILAGNEDGSTGMFEFYIPDCWGDVTSAGYNLFGALNPGGTTCEISGDTTGNLAGEVGSALDPRLTTLGDYGGPTETHALLSDSPAIDAGDPTGCIDGNGAPLGGDQRRYTRSVDGPGGDSVARCDIGSYEYGAPPGIFFDDFERKTIEGWSTYSY